MFLILSVSYMYLSKVQSRCLYCRKESTGNKSGSLRFEINTPSKYMWCIVHKLSTEIPPLLFLSIFFHHFSFSFELRLEKKHKYFVIIYNKWFEPNESRDYVIFDWVTSYINKYHTLKNFSNICIMLTHIENGVF